MSNEMIENGNTCCKDFENWRNRMHNVYFSTGSGEISGTIWIDEYEITFSDGWNDYPSLILRYCPYCGAHISNLNPPQIEFEETQTIVESSVAVEIVKDEPIIPTDQHLLFLEELMYERKQK